MKIGLIIAIESELVAFINHGAHIETEIVNNRKIYSCKIGNKEIYAIQSGYGIIDASAATQLLITKYDVDTIINFGVTGALDKSLKVSDLFVVAKVRDYAYDASGIDPVKPNQYVEFKDEFIPIDEELYNFTKKIYPEIKDAVVASGSRFVYDKNEKLALNGLGCNICDMEIAAIARVCYLNKVRCLSIKCISDTFDGNGEDFVKNVTASAKKAFDVILDLLNRM